MNILPFIMVLTCTEGYKCDAERDRAMYPAPSWEVCFHAAEQSKTTMAFENEEFAVTIACVGKYVEN